MLRHRLIPCLQLQNKGLVKTKKFGNPVYIGDPINAVKIFNEKEVDELILLDITASKERRGPNYAQIERIAGECFMPLCYGGGVTSVEQAEHLCSIGVEKVCIQTGALDDIRLLKDISAKIGSQSVLLSVDVQHDWFGRSKLYASAKGARLGVPWLDFIQRAVDAGAGEIVLTSVDRDGTMLGLDLDIIRAASAKFHVPIIAMGGVGSLAHVKDGLKAGASAIAAGSYFVFQGPHRAVLITYPAYADLESISKENESNEV